MRAVFWKYHTITEQNGAACLETYISLLPAANKQKSINAHLFEKKKDSANQKITFDFVPVHFIKH